MIQLEVISLNEAMRLVPYPRGKWDMMMRLRNGRCSFGYARQDPMTGKWKYFIFKEAYLQEMKKDEKLV